VGFGKAVISTPYRYARELLADGRGLLVPSRDSGAIAEQVISLLTDPTLRAGVEQRAAAYGRGMTWPVVARQYLESFARARATHAGRRRSAFQAKTLANRGAELPEIKL
jgi:glycosyltransferase involved in cell wall biosynthesis